MRWQKLKHCTCSWWWWKEFVVRKRESVKQKKENREKACVYNHKLILLFSSFLFPLLGSLCYAHSTLPSKIEANTFLKCKFWCLLANLSSQTLVFCVITSEREKSFFFALNSEAIQARALGAFSIFFSRQKKICTVKWKKKKILVSTRLWEDFEQFA